MERRNEAPCQEAVTAAPSLSGHSAIRVAEKGTMEARLWRQGRWCVANGACRGGSQGGQGKAGERDPRGKFPDFCLQKITLSKLKAASLGF